MPVRVQGSGRDDGTGGGAATSAVERSLEEFIARANSTPAEVTEIVRRLPAAEVRRDRRPIVVGVSLAFLAGAIAVLVVTRFVLAPAAAPVAAPAVKVIEAPPAPAPAPIVIPMPSLPPPMPAVVAEAEADAEAATETEADAKAETDVTEAVAERPRPKRATRPARKPRPEVEAPVETPKKASGLVDPFAN
jgi:hypothetical protein